MIDRQAGIILVEDDPDLRQSLEEYLNLAGYHLDAVGSALEFYNRLAAGEYAVAILDLALPDQDGLQLVEYLRQNSGTKIIILSARDGTEDRISGYRAGADVYLVKPVDSRELAAAIDSQLHRSRAAADPPPTLPCQPAPAVPWTFDRESWTLITPARSSVELTGKEMELLTLLVARPGAPVTREEILPHLYRRDDEHTAQALESLVHRLRQKIQAAGGGNPVKTCRGVGYSFSAPVNCC